MSERWITPLPDGRYAVIYPGRDGRPVRLIVSSAEEAERMESEERRLARAERALRLTRGEKTP